MAHPAVSVDAHPESSQLWLPACALMRASRPRRYLFGVRGDRGVRPSVSGIRLGETGEVRYAPPMHNPGTALGPVSWERMSQGIEKVRDRLLRATAALESAGIAYAVIGGNAVAAWVSRIDDSVVRSTRDVDLLVRREDMPAILDAMGRAGFLHRSVSILGGQGRIEMFLDGPGAKARDAVHLLFANEKVNPEAPEPSPDVAQVDPASTEFRLLDLEALVTMKLTSNRRKDQVHLLDMLEIGQIDASWLERVPPSLRERLQAILDDPEG